MTGDPQTGVDPSPTTGRGSQWRGIAASMGVLIIGAATVLVAGGRVWELADGSRVGAPTAAPYDIGTSPGQGWSHALGLLALAAVLAVFATRGRWRTVIGAIVAAAALLTAAMVAATEVLVTMNEHHRTSWPLVAIGGCLAVFAGALAVLTRGSTWPSMSNRYEREARAAAKPLTPWEAIDRGEDPTS